MSQQCGAHLQVGLSQIIVPDDGWRLQSFPITMKAKGAKKTLPEYGTRHCGVGGAMPICVFTQKADVCVGTQSCWFVQQHKMQMSNALSEAPQRH